MRLIDPVVSRFLAYMRPYKWWIVGATICGLIKFNVPLLFPLVLKEVINTLTGTGPIELTHVYLLLVLLLLIYCGWAVATYFRSVLADRASQRMVFDLRLELFQHLQRLPPAFFEKRHSGSISSRVLGDINIAQNYVGNVFTNAILDLSTLILIAIILLQENIRLAIAALLVIPVYLLVNRHFKKRITTASKLAQNKFEQISGQIHEQVASMSVVQAFTGEKSEQRRYVQGAREYLGYLTINVSANAMATTLIGFITTAAPIFVIGYGVHEVVNNNLSPGGLVAFYAYLGMLYGPLNRLSELNILLANSLSAMQRIFEVFDTAPEVTDRINAREITTIQGDVELKNVSFCYQNKSPVLNHVSFTIAAGKTLALVGRSGAGKSTLIKLLPRYFDVTEGSILIDNTDIRELRLKALRRNISLVAQDPILFSGTIAENILYGRRSASAEEIVAAAQHANAHEFIERLPNGYHTEIGERGITLSGGQRQRIALARAFLKDAPIIILDEATSALDSESERMVQQAMQRLMQTRTAVVIAHRLGTVKNADLIVVLDQGQVVQQGTHEQLIQDQKGIYRILYNEHFVQHT